MLKGHPKGLFVVFFANMGERFGYYTMLAIFVLYLQAKFGYSTAEAGQIYGGFLFGIYFLPLLGGIIADNWLGYGKTIVLGTIVMFIGYAMLAVPDMGIGMVIGALSVISLGAGLIGYFWDKLEIWQFFAILVGVTLLSALFIFSVMKLLEKAANS